MNPDGSIYRGPWGDAPPLVCYFYTTDTGAVLVEEQLMKWKGKKRAQEMLCEYWKAQDQQLAKKVLSNLHDELEMKYHQWIDYDNYMNAWYTSTELDMTFPPCFCGRPQQYIQRSKKHGGRRYSFFFLFILFV